MALGRESRWLQKLTFKAFSVIEKFIPSPACVPLKSFLFPFVMCVCVGEDCLSDTAVANAVPQRRESAPHATLCLLWKPPLLSLQRLGQMHAGCAVCNCAGSQQAGLTRQPGGGESNAGNGSLPPPSAAPPSQSLFARFGLTAKSKSACQKKVPH
eukprot:882081-Prorocentrum_minimum.AAC.2